MLKEVYNLRNDEWTIRTVQDASLNSKDSGPKVENGRLFGSPNWFDAIESGEIKKYFVQGTISDVRMTGHNDFAELVIDSNGNNTYWPRLGEISLNKIGQRIKLTYVILALKRSTKLNGGTSKCIIQIEIG